MCAQVLAQPRAPAEFQSLIGRLKTIVRVFAERTKGLFQSLIGRLKTAIVARARQSESGFNPS